MAILDKSFLLEKNIISLNSLTIAIVVAEWNSEITTAMKESAVKTLRKYKCRNILIDYVPGVFELPLAVQTYLESDAINGIICIGCVIKGETPHFDYICQSCAYGITKLNLEYGVPVTFGVLTTNNIEQAKQRSGLIPINGKYDNKGEGAALSLIKMLGARKSIIEKLHKIKK